MGTTQKLQPELPFTGAQLAVTGMRLAVESAEQKNKGWLEDAIELFREFLPGKQKFMCEHFRDYCKEKGLPTPPSKRAFGAVMFWARREGLIRSVGTDKVKNPKAHRANASVWVATKAVLA